MGSIKSNKGPVIDTRFLITPGLYVPGQNEPVIDGRTDYAKASMSALKAPEPYEREVITKAQSDKPLPVKEVIEQKLVPSTGTKLVCTTCGTQNWHTLMLRRKAGLIEGLCKQEDGSGCYPLATRRNCSYTYPEQIDCPQVAEYSLALGKERLNPRQVCRDHVGELLKNGPLYLVWPLED